MQSYHKGHQQWKRKAEEKVRAVQPEGAPLLLLALKREESGREARRAGSLEKLAKARKGLFPRARWGMQSCQHLGVGPMKAISNFWPLELWIVHLSRFKSLDL